VACFFQAVGYFHAVCCRSWGRWTDVENRSASAGGRLVLSMEVRGKIGLLFLARPTIRAWNWSSKYQQASSKMAVAICDGPTASRIFPIALPTHLPKLLAPNLPCRPTCHAMPSSSANRDVRGTSSCKPRPKFTAHAGRIGQPNPRSISNNPTPTEQ
jgi:hypothetical protein